MWNRRAEVGFADDCRQRHEVRCHEDDLRAHLVLDKEPLEKLLAATGCVHRDVLEPKKLLARELLARDWMSGAKQAAEMVSEQALLEEIRRLQVGKITDREIDLARSQPVTKLVRRERHRADRSERRNAPEALEDPGQKHH